MARVHVVVVNCVLVCFVRGHTVGLHGVCCSWCVSFVRLCFIRFTVVLHVVFLHADFAYFSTVHNIIVCIKNNYIHTHAQEIHTFVRDIR